MIFLIFVHQSQAVKAVEREPYNGDVVPVANSGKRDFGALDVDTPTRPCTRHGGVRDLHESSFSLSGRKELLLLFQIWFWKKFKFGWEVEMICLEFLEFFFVYLLLFF